MGTNTNGGILLGYGIGISPRTAAFDADALAYFATAGITDSTAQIQINDFVKGIKDLGLWSSMVSWPLRSSQNAGTGTTAYSLGGFGTYNGTLVNGPTWGVDGITIPDNARITTGAFANQPNSIFSVVKYNTFSSITVWYDGTIRQHLYRGANSQQIVGFAGASINALNRAQGVWFGIQLSFDGENGSYSIDGQANVIANFGANNLTQFRMGTSALNQEGGTNAFHCIINASNAPLLYSLYKSTLGQGLGLP